jgi:hypothetical protein
MSGLYTVPFQLNAVTAQLDLVEVTAAANKVLVWVGYYIANLSDAGDSQEEMLSVIVKSGQTTSGSGGSAVTPVPNDPSGAVAAGFVAEVGNTTKATAGTILTHRPEGWNVRVGERVLLPETEQIILGGGRRATWELAKTPADAIDLTGFLVMQEIG